MVSSDRDIFGRHDPGRVSWFMARSLDLNSPIVIDYSVLVPLLQLSFSVLRPLSIRVKWVVYEAVNTKGQSNDTTVHSAVSRACALLQCHTESDRQDVSFANPVKMSAASWPVPDSPSCPHVDRPCFPASHVFGSSLQCPECCRCDGAMQSARRRSDTLIIQPDV